MSDFFYRTEDIRPDEVLKYFVETQQDRAAIEALKGRNPTILVGSRGVGKSFLLRVAQKELLDNFDKNRIFPIYISFVRSSLLQSSDVEQFKHWMLARICAGVIRSLSKEGLLGVVSRSVSILAGGGVSADPTAQTKIEQIAEAYEETWKQNSAPVDTSELPSIDDFRESIEDIAELLKIERFVLFIDEAAHIFLPEQQRQFFTLYRDLRSHCLTCNAAVYPGVTSYGETFQPVHDATMLSIERDVLSQSYVDNMREIVEKQADSTVLSAIAQSGRNFATLAYASTGNPRLLLKTLTRTPKMNSSQINDVIKNFYRTEIWSEHSTLSEKYSGHKAIIDWGRDFIETYVIPEARFKNEQYLSTAGKSVSSGTSAFFWVHRDTPEIVKEALRVLAYTGIVVEYGSGIKASRSEIGKRYLVNLGCLFSQEQAPASTAFEIAKALAPKRMTEYGANHSSYKSLVDREVSDSQNKVALALEAQLAKPISVLDITPWQKEKLTELGLTTVGDILGATEKKLKEASYVGDVRARRMRNAAVAAVLEYLSG